MKLTEKLTRNKIYRDVIHNEIVIEYKIIDELTQTAEFNRLRRVKQLGCSSFLFVNAEHSRFQHSLGVYEIARRIILNKQELANRLESREQIALLIAALLHDIGHGPFSHTFEELVPTFNHEEMTQKLILDPKSKINQVLTSYDADLAFEIVQIIKSKHQNKLLNQIISAQIDVDRMDYLLRDSYYSGTNYGLFDLTKIIRSIDIFNDEIIFDKSALFTIENYLMGRYYMFAQVYLNPRAYGYEKLLIKIIQANELLYRKIVNMSLDIEQFLKLDDNYIYNEIGKLTSNNQLIGLQARIFYHVAEIITIEVRNKTQLEKLKPKINQIFENDKETGFWFYEKIELAKVYNKVKKPIKINNSGIIKELSKLAPLISKLEEGEIDSKQYCIYLLTENEQLKHKFKLLKDKIKKIEV